MIVNFEVERDILVVMLKGELDHNIAEEIRVKIDDKIESCIIDNMVFDFSGITFMDSSGIGVVIGRYRKMKAKGGNLYIANAKGNINRIFELSGLYKVIKKYDTVEEAVRCI